MLRCCDAQRMISSAPSCSAVANSSIKREIVIDIPAGALSGAGCSAAGKPILTDGMLAIAINIGHFTPLAPFATRIAELFDYVKSCPTAKGVDSVLLPGEPELRTRAVRERDGVPIEPGTWHLIAGVAERFKIATGM